MKKNFTLFFAILFSAVSYSQGVITPLQDWQNTSGVQNGIYKSKIVTDNSKNVYVAGATMNGATTDILLVKYNSSGAQLWTAQYDGGGNGEDVATGLCVDSSGNVYITGYATGTAMSPTNVDMVTIKYDNSGVQQWLTAYNGTGNAYDYGADITVDNNGNVYVTGKSYNASANVNTDIIIIKYDPIGTQQWVTRYDHTTQLNDEGVKISVRNNSVVVSGLVQTNGTAYKRAVFSYEDATGVQTGAIINSTSSSGADLVNDMVQDSLGNIYIAGSIPVAGQGYDYSILKLNPNLGIEWLSTYSGNSNLDDIAKAIQIDTSGNVYVTGYTTSSTEGRNFATVKYSSSGTQQWIQAYNDTLNGDDEANALVLDSVANVYVTGYTTTNNNHTDYYIMKYNSSGTQQWAMGGDGDAHLDDKATGIAIDNKGAVTITGQSALTTTTSQYLTNKYSEKNIITPTDYNNETAASNFLFYKNSGQLVNTSNQAIPNVKFYTNNTSPRYYINNNSYSFVFAHVDTVASTQDTLHRIDLTFDGINANNNGKIYPLEEEKEGHLNYFLPQCPNGITEIHGNQRLLTPDLYSNIDLEYSSNQKGAKYYFIVKPGGDPANIQLNYTGASSFNLDGNTNALTISSIIGSITYDRPTVYQLSTTNTIIPIVAWTADWQTNAANNKYKFNIGSYDSTKTLIIEVDQGNEPAEERHLGNPDWATPFGGAGYDVAMDVKNDVDGNSYWVGYTNSDVSFPQNTGFAFPFASDFDAFICKFGSPREPWYGSPNGVVPNGDKLLWIAFWGGTNDDKALALDVTGNDAGGHVYVTGYTSSPDFSITNTNPFYNDSYSGNKDAFIVDIEYYNLGVIAGNCNSTFIGGAGDDIANDIKYKNGVLALGGITYSTPSVNTCAVPNSSGDNGFPLCSSTFHNTYSGSGDGFLIKTNNTGTLLSSEYIGGSNYDEIKEIAFNSTSDLFFVGTTASNAATLDPIIWTGAYNQGFNGGLKDVMVGKLSSSPWLSLYGGSGDDYGNSIAIKSNNDVFIAGATGSSTPECVSCFCTAPSNVGEFPLCPNTNAYFQGSTSTGAVYNGGTSDGFIAQFNNTGEFVWGTYRGGNNTDIINSIAIGGIDVFNNNAQPMENIFVVGETFSSDNANIRYYDSNLPGSFVLPSNQLTTTGSSEGYFSYFDATLKMRMSDYCISQDPNGQSTTTYDPNNVHSYNNAISVWSYHTFLAGATTNPYSMIRIGNGMDFMGNTGVYHDAQAWNFNNGQAINPTAINADAYLIRISQRDMPMISGIPEHNTTIPSFLVFPNPSTGVYTIKTDDIDINNATIGVYDILGKCVYLEQKINLISGKLKTIDLSGISNGFYNIVISNTEFVKSLKVIKQ